ncbi:hypothetical protein AB3S75_025581 [Citrus x aurantiifolia]
MMRKLISQELAQTWR